MQLKLPWALPRPNKRKIGCEVIRNEIPAFGSTLTDKREECLRLALQNINGILTSKELIGTEELEAMDQLGIDILGLVETNINWSLDARQSFMTAANLKFRPARCAMSSGVSLKEGYLPGGTAMVAAGKVCGRVQDRGMDRFGSCTWMALRGRNDTGIIVVTAYRVCQKAGTDAGENTAYMREYLAMREAGTKRPDPRNRVLDDISEILTEWGQKGYHPLVLMDANAPFEEKKLGEFIMKHGLIDLVTDVNQGTAPTTYARGPNRIDFVLGDRHVRRAVQKSGSLALHDGVSLSDHTMQFVDFDEKMLFGDDSFTPMAGYQREFRLYDVKKKQMFQDKLLEIYKHQKIPERVTALAARYARVRELSPRDVECYQELDNEIVEAIRAAAAATGRKNFGYQRSPALCEAGMAVRMHRAIFSCLRRGTSYTDKIIQLAKSIQYNLPSRDELTFKQGKTNLNEAWKAKRKVQKEDAEHRANWLEQIAAEKAAETGEDPDKALQQMIRAARKKGMFKRLRAILKPEWSSLDYIEVPNEKWYLNQAGDELFEFDNGIFVARSCSEENLFDGYGTIKVPPKDVRAVQVEVSDGVIYVQTPESEQPMTWTKVTKPVEIEAWIMKRNKRHLQQMYLEESPPTTARWDEVLDEYGTSETVDQILNGTFDATQLDDSPEMKHFIEALQMTQKERSLTVPEQMTRKDFQQLFRVQKEETTSSPSGIHYTLWKAIAEKDELADIHAQWVSMPFMYGFICKRWLQEIDCMLEKKPGVRQIHILRIIGIMEGDFNGFLKWAYNKHVMPNAEKAGMSQNQWGGRRNRSAIACALRKVVTWEYFRYVKETIAVFPGDLQSCFDRMLARINSIISMKKGMSKNACKCRAATVENFERPVRTAAGTSTATYKHEDGEVRMGGEVQGKPDNMQLWTISSDILLQIHDKMCAGVTMLCAQKRLCSKRSSDAYVDDQDSLASAPRTQSAEEAVRNLERSAQIWVTLCSFLGQALAFHKSFWQLLAWMRLGGYYIPMPRRKFQELEVNIQDHRGKSSQIQYKHIDEPNAGLGVDMCPNGDQKPEFNKRHKQAKNYASRVTTTRFGVQEAWTALTVSVLPSITYPFGITRFTKKQLHKLAVLIDGAFLPKLRISRKMKRIAVYAPVELGGIGYPSIATIQDYKGINLLVRQIQHDKELATDLRILLSQAQLESGLTTPILDDTELKLEYLEPGLISHMRYRLQDLGGSVIVEDAWCPEIQREGDQSIMDAIGRLPRVKKRELEHANQCRKWLRVITVAEMASMCGKYIPPDRFNGRWRAQSKLKWPRQPPPEREMWDVFRRLFKRAFATKNLRNEKAHRLPLDQELGAWFKAERHIEYPTYRVRKALFHRQADIGTSSYERYVINGEANYFVRDGVRFDLPMEAHPTELILGKQGDKVHAGTEYCWVQNVEKEKESSDEDEEEEIERSEIETLESAEELIGCSDGSFDPISCKAAFNWRVVTADETGLTTVSAPVCTNPKYLNSYRAEYAGIRSLIRYLHKHKLYNKRIKVYCDSESCVKTLQKGPPEGSLQDLEGPESDIIASIFSYIIDFRDIQFEWVESHQDENDDTPFEERPLPVRLNIKCDEAAKECMWRSANPTKRPKPLKGAKATLYLGNHMVTTKMKEQIIYAAHEAEMNAFTRKVMEWTDRQHASVNIRALGRAKKRLGLQRSIRTSKMLFNWLNTGQQKRKMKSDGTCPCCGKEEEDFIHLYHCTSESMQAAFRDAIAEAKSKLVKDGIPSNIYNGFIDAMCAAAHHIHPDPSYQRDDEKIIELIEAQETLGMESILKGFHHVDWAYELQRNWKEPQGERKQKDVVEQSVSLVFAAWDVFEALWNARNIILHGDESEIMESETDRKTQRLIEFQRKQQSMLNRADHFLIDYNEMEIRKWSAEKKHQKLLNLERLHRVYLCELKREAEGLRQITDYFHPVRK